MIIGDAGRAIAEDIQMSEKESSSRDYASYIIKKLTDAMDLVKQAEQLMEEIPEETVWEDQIRDCYCATTDLVYDLNSLAKDIEKE